MDILAKVTEAIKKDILIKRGDRVIIGVSGGPDSVCLLYLLNSLKDKIGFSLYIAHLDHALRRNSFRDAEFVKRIAEKLGIPFVSKRLKKNTYGSSGSIEELARNARLSFLASVAKRIRADKIALAHNIDDQAETVLMRIIRGTGLYGLSAMLSKRKMLGYSFIRPLLGISRKQIEGYLKKHKIASITDSSNLESLYFRNKLRNKLIPLIEKEYNKGIKECLANLADCAGNDFDYLRKAADRYRTPKKSRINIKSLKRMHKAILRLKLRDAIASVQGNTRRVSLAHTREVEDLIFTRPAGSIVDLPKGVSVLKKNASLSFYLRKS